MTKEQLVAAIYETTKQENLFRLAGNTDLSAWWILERVKLRSQLFCLLQKEAFSENNNQ